MGFDRLVESLRLPRLVLLIGKRAVGKTTMLRELVGRLHRRVADVAVWCDRSDASSWRALGADVRHEFPADLAAPSDRPRLLVVEDTVLFEKRDLDKIKGLEKNCNLTVIMALQSPCCLFEPDFCLVFRYNFLTNRKKIHACHFQECDETIFETAMQRLGAYEALAGDGDGLMVLRASVSSAPFICNRIGAYDHDLRFGWTGRAEPREAAEQKMSCDMVVTTMALAPLRVRAAAQVCAAWRRALDVLPHPVEFVDNYCSCCN
jgi:hypothetical protein